MKESRNKGEQEVFLDEALRKRQVDRFLYEFIFCLSVGVLCLMLYLTFFGSVETREILHKFWEMLFGKINDVLALLKKGR